MSSFSLRRILGSGGRWLRDGWLIVGVTVLLVLLLETCYRGQGNLRRRLSGARSSDAAPRPSAPFDTTAWAAQYHRDHRREEEVLWKPFVYVRNPTFRGMHMSVDSLGWRITPQDPPDARPVVRVFFMGGSTTFGWYQRDSFTIAATAGRRLQQTAGSRARIEVTNFGVPGHTFTQEMLELLFQLRDGARPDVVVFYDGINDVMATVQNRRAGLPQNEANRIEDFNRGRMLAAERSPGIRTDVTVARRLFGEAGKRLELVQRVVAAKAVPPRERRSSDSLAREIALTFAANARLIEALAQRYGFQPLYVWQPALLTMRKPLTAYERWLLGPSQIKDVHGIVPTYIGAAMKPVVGNRFIDATDLFLNDSTEIYADVYGHTYERANPRIVDTLMTVLDPAVRAAVLRRSQPPRR